MIARKPKYPRVSSFDLDEHGRLQEGGVFSWRKNPIPCRRPSDEREKKGRTIYTNNDRNNAKKKSRRGSSGKQIFPAFRGKLQRNIE